MKPVALACLAVLLLTACSDQQPLQPPAGPAPSALIMDGAHHGGNPDFFFLPPLAADPSGGPNFDPGKFNPNLAPTAEVCRLTGDPASGAVDCATDIQGQPVLVFGPKPMVLAVEQYQVTWDTKSATLLDASKFYRIIVRGARRGTMLGLLDVDPVTGGLKDVRTGEVVQFQDGRSLPSKVRIEQGACGVTNPEHVEQVVTNHITTPTGTADVTTNTGFAGARLVDNWLPATAVAAGIDRVVVIIERVPVNNAVTATSCLKSGFKELEGCYRFRTDPDLHLYGPFNATVIAGVCFEQPIHSDAPYEMFRREETGEQGLVHLDDSDAPFLNCASFSPTPTTVGVSPGAGAGRWAAARVYPGSPDRTGVRPRPGCSDRRPPRRAIGSRRRPRRPPGPWSSWLRGSPWQWMPVPGIRALSGPRARRPAGASTTAAGWVMARPPIGPFPH